MEKQAISNRNICGGEKGFPNKNRKNGNPTVTKENVYSMDGLGKGNREN